MVSHYRVVTVSFFWWLCRCGASLRCSVVHRETFGWPQGLATEVRSGREWVLPLAVVTTRARIGNASARFHAHLYQARQPKVNIDFLF